MTLDDNIVDWVDGRIASFLARPQMHVTSSEALAIVVVELLAIRCLVRGTKPAMCDILHELGAVEDGSVSVRWPELTNVFVEKLQVIAVRHGWST